MARITSHARQRLQERRSAAGSADAHVRNVAEYGIHHRDLRGELLLWVNEKYAAYKTASNIRIYKGFIYFFSNQMILMTTYPIPERFLDHPEKNFTAEGYIKYLYRPQDLRDLRDDPFNKKMVEIVSIYTEISCWKTVILSSEIKPHKVEVRYVCNGRVALSEQEKMIKFFYRYFNRRISFKKFFDADTGRVLTRTQYERKEDGKEYTGKGFDRKKAGKRKNRTHNK